MATANSTSTRTRSKVNRPEVPEDFPLSFHDGAKQFCSRINRKLHYFGSYKKGWQNALDRYTREAPLIKQGLDPKSAAIAIDLEHLTVKGLCNLLLTAKEKQVQLGELSKVSFRNYEEMCKGLCTHFGDTLVCDLTPAHFQSLRETLYKPKSKDSLGRKLERKKISATSVHSRITRIRSIFSFGIKNGYIKKTEHELYGTQFDKPSKKNKRQDKVQRYVDRDSILKMIEAADPLEKALVLIGINLGIGNTDLGLLEEQHIDFETGFFEFARNKTGEERQGFLWQETLDAITDYLKVRPSTIDCDKLFLTNTGLPLVDEAGRSRLTGIFNRLAGRLKVKKPGVCHYGLRHTFETVAENATGDTAGVKFCMGHSDDSMAANYRASFWKNRLKRISEAVHGWLFKGEGEDE